MSQRKVTNVAASVAERLKQLAKTRDEEFGFVLNRYGVERLLYRLAQSTLRDRFVLKGASLFSLWSDEPHRATRDVDLLGQGDPSPEALQEEIGLLCGIEGGGRRLGLRPDTVAVTMLHQARHRE